MQPEVTCNWVHADTLGYGRMAVRLVAALDKIGVRVVDGQDSEVTNAVTWMSVPSHARKWREGQHTSILTMWETQRLAEGMLEALDNFDLIMVPSQQNLELFGEHHPNVKLVLLGVDEQWKFQSRQTPRQWFDFLIGGSGPRKGTDLAVAAFQKVFGNFHGDGPIPRLVMKNPKREGFAGDRIEMVGGRISGEDELALYARAHCYLQPSRGEGFGLQPLQAIAQGCPTILTDAHGHASFAHLGYPISAKSSEADYFTFGYAGQWWEPDFDELCERMRWVYDHYDEAVLFAEQSAATAAREFTWERSARMLADAIGEDQMSVPYAGSGDWIEADLRRFKVQVTQTWKADIAGVHYFFEPNVVYWESADVVRGLFDAGLLAKESLGDCLPSLNAQQVASLGTYSAAHSYCHACGQRYNSDRTKADDMMTDNELVRLRARVAELEGKGPKDPVPVTNIWAAS